MLGQGNSVGMMTEGVGRGGEESLWELGRRKRAQQGQMGGGGWKRFGTAAMESGSPADTHSRAAQQLRATHHAHSIQRHATTVYSLNPAKCHVGHFNLTFFHQQRRKDYMLFTILVYFSLECPYKN